MQSSFGIFIGPENIKDLQHASEQYFTESNKFGIADCISTTDCRRLTNSVNQQILLFATIHGGLAFPTTKISYTTLTTRGEPLGGSRRGSHPRFIRPSGGVGCTIYWASTHTWPIAPPQNYSRTFRLSEAPHILATLAKTIPSAGLPSRSIARLFHFDSQHVDFFASSKQ